MIQQNSKKSLAIVALALVLIAGTAVPADACECIDNLMPWNWGRSNECVATTYAPAYTPAAPALASCSTCPTPTSYMTARYIPQTSYRTVYRTTPVTTCMPVNQCDPCTGCPTTSFRPVTGYRRVAQLVPYTTYRIAWQENRCYTSCYTPCATSCSPCSTCTTSCGSCYTDCGSSYSDCGPCGVTSGSVVTSSDCSSCGVPSTSTPATPPTTYSNGSQKPALPSGTEWDTKRPVESKEIKPTPQPDPTTSRQNYQSRPFQVPQLVPTGRTASSPVRLISYQSSSPRTVAPSTTMGNVVDDTNEWRAR